MRWSVRHACIAAAIGLVVASSSIQASDDRRAVLESAEIDLAGGDAAAAAAGFERAGAMAHTADAEMGAVRAMLQQGEYRRALAFCAHVAGAHLDAPEAAVLYAWLLRVGGHWRESEGVLAAATRRSPAHPVVQQAARALSMPLPAASGALLDTPHRLAPAASDIAAGRVVSSGVLFDDGSRALIPALATALAPGSRLWVRNGLGQAREAMIDGAASPSDGRVLILRLAEPLPSDRMGSSDGRAPFAGSPAFVAEYAEGDSQAPAWPWLRSGFLGSPQRDGKSSRLGVEVAAQRLGGPVFDASGQVAGIALRAVDGQAQLLPTSNWPRFATTKTATTAAAVETSAAGRPPLAGDEIYERALRRALQVIAVP